MSATHPTDLSIDQRHALKTAAVRLEGSFEGIFGAPTIERFLYTSYDQFAGRATIPNFLPLLAERFARQRLNALARVEGKISDGKPVVLFLCVHNAGRSQMALGFFQQLAGDDAVAWSGGSEPGDQVNPTAVAAMAERGVDISHEYPKPWTDELSARPTSSSRWAAATHARSSPVSATRTGCSTTQPNSTSTVCGGCATTSSDACTDCSTS